MAAGGNGGGAAGLGALNAAAANLNNQQAAAAAASANLLTADDLQNYLLRQAAIKAQNLQSSNSLNLNDFGISSQLANELLNQQFLQVGF